MMASRIRRVAAERGEAARRDRKSPALIASISTDKGARGKGPLESPAARPERPAWKAISNPTPMQTTSVTMKAMTPILLFRKSNLMSVEVYPLDRPVARREGVRLEPAGQPTAKPSMRPMDYFRPPMHLP